MAFGGNAFDKWKILIQKLLQKLIINLYHFVIYRAKKLLAHSKNYKKLFIFVHVCLALKISRNLEMMLSLSKANGNFESSQSKSPTPALPWLFSFSLNMNEENLDGASTQRRVKNEKLWRKMMKKYKNYLNYLAEIFKKESENSNKYTKSKCHELKMSWKNWPW